MKTKKSIETINNKVMVKSTSTPLPIPSNVKQRPERIEKDTQSQQNNNQ